MIVAKSFAKPALIAGLLAGTLDLCGAVVNVMLSAGHFPSKILQYIASGAFGKTAFDGSVSSNLWGLFFHYFIAIGLSFFYFIIYPRVKLLQQSVILSAILYGLFAWAVTNMIIVPLSAIHGPVIPTDYWVAAKAAIVLVICIGFPIAWLAKKFYK
jgi:hypothetical protein